MEKIKCISEAFSMQPELVIVTNPDRRSRIYPERDISRIELEVLDEKTNVYVAYNFEGQKKHQWLANAVNVTYF